MTYRLTVIYHPPSDAAAFGAGMSSPEGAAAVADVENFATGGATMLTGEVTTYA